MSGRTKTPGKISAGNAKRKIEPIIKSIKAPGAGFAITINKAQGGNADAILHGEMMTIVSALRALARIEPRFKSMLQLAIAEEPLQTAVNKLKKRSDEEEE